MPVIIVQRTARHTQVPHLVSCRPPVDSFTLAYVGISKVLGDRQFGSGQDCAFNVGDLSQLVTVFTFAAETELTIGLGQVPVHGFNISDHALNIVDLRPLVLYRLYVSERGLLPPEELEQPAVGLCHFDQVDLRLALLLAALVASLPVGDL